MQPTIPCFEMYFANTNLPGELVAAAQSIKVAPPK
jgi:hypothetical protein